MATVSQIQTNAVVLADKLITELTAALQGLAVAADDAQAIDTFVAYDGPRAIDVSGGLSQTTTIINLPDLVSFSASEAPEADDFIAVSTPNAPSVPTFDESRPTLNLPAPVTSAAPTAPGNQPDFSAPSIPSKPGLSLPTPVTFTPVAIPDIAGLDIPLFEATAPVDELIEPSTAFSFVELEYDSDLLRSVKAKLLGDLTNGGYGIETSDEAALWERERERSLKAADAAIEEATTQIAARGFLLPPGALFAAQQIAEQTALNTSVTVSRDIAIKRVDQFTQARQFALTKASELETTLMQYSGARAERALNAAKSVVEVGISLYQMRVEKLRALQDGYKSEAQVYETRIRANLATLEAQKLRIESSKLALDSQQVQAQIYEVQVAASDKLISLYRTEMEAAKIQAEIEGIKLQGFRTSVESYAEQVRAREAEFRMVEAQIRGEAEKVNLYRASAEAHRVVLEGVRVKAEAEEVVSRSQIESNKLKLDKLRAENETYRLALDKASLSNRAILERQGLGVEIEKVLDSKENTRRQTLQQLLRFNSEVARENAELAIKAAQLRVEAALKAKSLTLSGAEKLADARAQVASAALGQVAGVAGKNE